MYNKLHFSKVLEMLLLDLKKKTSKQLEVQINTKAMNIFLQGLSKEIKEGKHVALIIDNAGWHNSNELIVPDNITLIPLRVC